jgi:hypothetical protein
VDDKLFLSHNQPSLAAHTDANKCSLSVIDRAALERDGTTREEIHRQLGLPPSAKRG